MVTQGRGLVRRGVAHTHSLSSCMLLMLGLLRSTCSCIWLWLYCTTPTCDCPGSNCKGGCRPAWAPAHMSPRVSMGPGSLPTRPLQPDPSPTLSTRGQAGALPWPERQGPAGGCRLYCIGRGAGGSTTHLDQLVLAQPVDDFDNKVLGNLKVLQAYALRAVQHEEDVNGATPALWGWGGTRQPQPQPRSPPPPAVCHPLLGSLESFDGRGEELAGVGTC